MKLSVIAMRPLPGSRPSPEMAFSISVWRYTSDLKAFTPQFFRGSFHRWQIDFRIWSCLRIEHNGDPGHPGCNLLKQLEPLATERLLKVDKSGNVGAGTWEARDKTRADRIGYSNEHDWNCLRCLM